MPEVKIASVPELHRIVAASGLRPVFLKFSAGWCGPCKRITPYWHTIAAQYSRLAVFAEVDFDACRAVADLFQVTSLPTFVATCNVQNKLVGGNPETLQTWVEAHLEKIYPVPKEQQASLEQKSREQYPTPP
jgi:thioredoxin 1